MALFSVADLVAAVFLLIALIDAVQRHDERKSSRALLAAMAAALAFVLLDSCSGAKFPASTPDFVLYALAVITAVATKCIMLFYYSYCWQYFRERTAISKWLFLVPMALLGVTILAQACSVLSAGYLTVSGGTVTVNGSVPALINLAAIVFILYFPVLAFIKRKSVGTDAVLFVGLLNIFLILLPVMGLHAYTTCCIGCIVFATYALLQNGLYNRREQEQQALQASNDELQALNAQLQENQAQLEESTAEQEAQLEEIAALNAQLQENQARLEEASAEQEAQLEETQALNQELQESRDRISEALGMIEGLSQEYHTIWLVSKNTLRMRLIRSSGISTAKGAVSMAQKVVELDPTVKVYVEHYVMPEDQERALVQMSSTEILRHLEEKPHDIYAVNYLRKDDNGRISYHQIAFANADTQDGRKQFVLAFRDVDQIVKEEQAQKEELRKAKEAADAANSAKTSFLFNMSHDIRTPMNAIVGFTDLLKKHKDDPEKVEDYIAKIQSSSDFLLSLINNVLEMARIESGKEELDETACPTGVVTREIISVFEDQMRLKHISFTSHVDIHTPFMLADQPKLREICLNILSNAVKYTPEGGHIHIEMVEEPCEKPGYARLRGVCSDTGIGMSKEFLPTIFDEFTRAQSTTESGQQGTGLGMPIVKKLIDQMGGTIAVESELGKGTTFTVTVDLKVVENAADAKPAIESEAVPDDFTGKRILLAEDNDLNAEIAMEILGEVGFEVERAEDGVVCVDMLVKADPGWYDVILMDIQMPNLDGYGATRRIRALEDQKKAGIPIIAMTANAFDTDKRNAFDAGMDGHVAKPIEIPVLLQTLAEVFL